jgi:Amt family ammonium transporter
MVMDSASTAFMLVCMALVQFMTPGLAFFYGGLVSDKGVITMMMQSFVSMGISSIFWFIVGFSLCFGELWDSGSSDPRGGFVGNPWTHFGFRNVNANFALDGSEEGIPGLLFAAYQGMFCVITPALMTGCFADRFRFKAYLIFIVAWLVLVYCPFCHWVWGGGFLMHWGVWDFAGGIVVHITAGFSALATLLVVGKRPVPENPEELDKPHNVPFVALGTAMLWFGWFGFNGGSALASGGPAVAAAVNSEIAGSVALFTWLLIDWFRNGKPGLVGLCVGAIAGLATVTPAAGFIQPWAACVLGFVATFFCYGCCELRKKLGMDDALDVWGVHGMGGFLGTVLLGVLADGEDCGKSCVNPGTVNRSWEQLGKQLVAAVFCAVYSFIVTYCLLQLINLVTPIRPEKSRMSQMDAAEHGENAYEHSPVKPFERPIQIEPGSSVSEDPPAQTEEEI